MTRVLIVDFNGPGLLALGQCFAAVLQALLRQITCSLCAPYLGQAPPDGVFDGVVFTGSCVDVPEGWVLRYVRRQVTRWKVPIWGSCNGMLLAAFKMGGACAASPHGDEDGLAEVITSTDIGRYHPPGRSISTMCWDLGGVHTLYSKAAQRAHTGGGNS